MNDRILDFLTKGLSLEARQTILEKLNNISPMSIKRVLEKPDDYPTLRRMGYTDDKIQRYLAQFESRFADLNEYLHSQERPGFFSDPSDTYKASKEYFHLLKQREPEEIEKIMGSSYEDYVPRKYAPKRPPQVKSEGPSFDDD